MGITIKNDRIILSQAAAEKFHKKLNTKNSDSMIKRNNFLSESRKNMEVKQTSQGTVLFLKKNIY